MTCARPSTAADAPRLYGRRKGHRLSARRQGLLETILPQYAIPRPEPRAGALMPGSLFAQPMRGFALEVGFGKGEHLLAQALRRPDTGHIGCEPYVNGLASFADAMAHAPLDNVRVYPDDASHILAALADGCLETVWLIHPDPWPKKRHRKRRFVNPDMLDMLARVLRPGGELVIVTDHPAYRRWTAIQLAPREDFEWTAECARDWHRPHEGWLQTRYAHKASGEGRADTFFRYRRL